MPEFEGPLDLKEEPLVLFDVALDVDVTALSLKKLLLDEGAYFDFARTELEWDLVDGRGGGIKALAELCLYMKGSK